MGKKYFLTLVFLMLFSSVLSVSAGQEARIYGEDLQISEGTAWKIPVQIQGNPGIMGFRIHIEYPADKLIVLGTERGEVIEKGSLTDNVGKNQGSLDVLWNDTAETKENGVLFYVAAQFPEGMQDEFSLRLSYLQPDTFNEKWEDVVFKCQDITVSVKENQITDAENPAGESGTSDIKNPAGESGITDIKNPARGSEITDIEAYAEEKSLSEFIEESNANLDSARIVSLVEKEFGKNSVRNLGNLEDEAAAESAERVLDILEKEGIGTAEVIRTYGAKRKIQAVKALYEMAAGEEIAAEPEARNIKYASIPVLLFLSVVVLAVLAKALHMRRKDK